MSKSREKTDKSKTDDEVELLLKVTNDYKTAEATENTDWESFGSVSVGLTPGEEKKTRQGKSMRGICKEEDYSFLGISEQTTRGTTEGGGALEDDWRDRREERVRRRLEREQQERERLQEIEESKKEKQQQWESHVAELTSSQEKTLRDRLARLRRFRDFQRKVLVEESGMEGEAACLTVDQLLTRM
uniref:uncharacterized protein n=1 Tax=Centroberyx gerrardi TaxID=166262 RepID=UPI003AB0F101